MCASPRRADLRGRPRGRGGARRLSEVGEGDDRFKGDSAVSRLSSCTSEKHDDLDLVREQQLEVVMAVENSYRKEDLEHFDLRPRVVVDTVVESE